MIHLPLLYNSQNGQHNNHLIKKMVIRAHGKTTHGPGRVDGNLLVWRTGLGVGGCRVHLKKWFAIKICLYTGKEGSSFFFLKFPAGRTVLLFKNNWRYFFDNMSWSSEINERKIVCILSCLLIFTTLKNGSFLLFLVFWVVPKTHLCWFLVLMCTGIHID